MRPSSVIHVAGLAIIAGISVGASARSAEIFHSDAFSFTGPPGFATAGVAPFDPASGTLDRAAVSIIGTLQIGLTIPAGGVVTPIVDFDATGIGGGFSFAGTGARFLFPPQQNGAVVPPFPPLNVELTEQFSLAVTFNALSDLTGFAFADTLGNPAGLVPPLSVDGQRADFARAVGVLEDFLFSPVGFVPDSLGGSGTIFITYDFTPVEVAAVPEPTTMAIFAPCLLAAYGATRLSPLAPMRRRWPFHIRVTPFRRGDAAMLLSW
jgi:hypothetical protein